MLLAPFTIVLLAILVLAFQLNRQLFDQQQVIVNRLSHAAVRHAGQLQREHLRFYNIILNTRENLDQDTYDLQHNLLQSRINILKTTLKAANPPEETWKLYDNYVQEWDELQLLLLEWQTNPQNENLTVEIGHRMADAELNINQIASDVQTTFEDRMQNWADQSLFLNRLLTTGSLSFIVIIVIMSYGIYVLFQEQATHQNVLRTSEQRLRAILDAIPDAVYRVSSDGLYTDYKPASNEAHRLPEITFFQKKLHEVLPLDVAQLLQNGIQTVLADQQPLLIDYPLYDERNQQTRHYEARLLPSGAAEVQIIVRDVTEVKQQEEAAIQAQKLESLGVLAGGIAHDFNNLLTGMLGQASLAVAKINRGRSPLEHVQKVVISAERAADLTRQLLAYTGKGKFQIDLLDLNGLISDTTSLMGTVIPSDASLALALAEDLPPVSADRGQIQQVIMNLFINAIEALPEGKGKISIETEMQYIENIANQTGSTMVARANSTNELPIGHYIVVQVADTGIGMDQSTLSRIFDPFFSTKSKGHGLGLSATLGIVRTHQGALQVQSQPGEGTIFTLLLPAVCEEAVEEGLSPALEIPYKEEQSILIIDDEAHVREVATDILSESGFHVTTATNGLEGINFFRDHHRQIDIVLLDMKMPGLNGKDTYQQLQQIEPNIKVIFTSGYSDTEIDQHVHDSDLVTFLAKPYSAEGLTRQVNQMLVANLF